MKTDIVKPTDSNMKSDKLTMTEKFDLPDTKLADSTDKLTMTEKFDLPDSKLADSKVGDKGPPWWRAQRYILAYILFSGIMNIFCQRVNFSIAILCMVNHTAISHHDRSHLNDSSNSYNTTHHDQHHLNDSSNIYSTSQTATTRKDSSLYSVSSKTSEHASGFPEYDILVFHNSQNSSVYSQQPRGNYSQHVNVLNSKAEMNNSDIETEHLFTSSSSSSDADVSSLATFPISGSKSEICNPESASDSDEQMREDGPLVWDKEVQGLLLGAIYWTYMMVSIPANLVVRKVKKKTIILYSMSVMSVMTMLLHVAALLSPWAVFVVKLVQGACTALAIIAMYGMWSKWAPPAERASLITLAMSGQNLGNIIVFPVSGLLCKHGFLGGWPSIFYVFGIFGFLWIILFFSFTDESPSVHRFITERERSYITSALSHTPHTRQPKVPWSSIMTSLPFWGIVIGQFSFTWGLLLILSTLPQYMYEVLRFDIKSNGVFTMLPYIALLFVTQAAGGISDFVIRRRILSILWTRRLCVLTANLVPAVLLTAMSFLDHTQAALAITLLVLAVGISGFALSGFLVSPYDIAPRFATEMMIIINTAATMPGIVANYFVAAVTKDQTREQWQIVYFLTSAIYVLGAACFCLLGRGEVQPWAMEDMSLVVSAAESATDVETRAAEKKELMSDN